MTKRTGRVESNAANTTPAAEDSARGGRTIGRKSSLGNVLHQISGYNPNSPFADWTLDALARRLQMDGVDVPSDVSAHDLIAFADDFYQGRQVPEAPEESREVKYVDRDGNEYVVRPAGYSRLHRSTTTDDRYYDGYLYCEQESYLPPMSQAESRAGAGNTGVYSDHEARSNRHGAAAPLVVGHVDYAARRQSSNPEQQEQYAADQGNNNNYWLSPNGESAEAPSGNLPGRRPSIGALAAADAAESNPGAIREQFQFMTPEDDFRIRKEFGIPSVETAEYYADLNHPRARDGNPYSVCKTKTGRHCHSRGMFWRLCDCFCEGSSSDFARFGQGVSLYFKFLKWGFWTFLVLTILSLPTMVINAGPDGPDGIANGLLGTTMLGNLADNVLTINQTGENTTVIRDHAKSRVIIPLLGTEEEPYFVDRDILARFYAVHDLFLVFVFFLSCQWLHYFESEEQLRVAKRHISIEDYTIQVVRVPPNVDEYQIAKFFGDLTGEPVADVCLAQDNGDLIDLYVKRGKVIDRLWKAASRVHLLKSERKMNPKGSAIRSDVFLERRLKDSVAVYDRLLAKYNHMTDLRNQAKHTHKALSAFVTFETQAGFLRCLDFYPSGYIAKKRQPPQLQMNGMKIRVRQAPPPSTVKWENMGYEWKERLCRRQVSIFFTLLGLGLSFVASYVAVRFRQDVSGELVQGCDVQNQNSTRVAEIFAELDRGTIPDSVVEADIIKCYCTLQDYQRVIQSLAKLDAPCHTFWSTQTQLFGYTAFTTAIVAFVNVVLEEMIVAFAQYEKHHALVNLELSVAKRIFVALFVNTGLILLIVNANTGLDVFGKGYYVDFNSDWYSSVGVQLMLTLIFNVFTMHSFRGFLYTRFNCRKRHQNALSQRELNELYLGPVFHLALRTAQILSVIFVTMLYSSGIPALYPIACGTFGVYYWVDKYLFVRFYRTPPNYSNKLSMWATSMLSWATTFHLCFALWMFSAQGIFVDENTIGSDVSIGLATVFGVNASAINLEDSFQRRVTYDHIIPIFLVIVLSLIYRLVTYVFKEVDRFIHKWCFCLCCSTFLGGTTKRRYLNPNFSDARANGEIRGLDTYNILRNPIYARSFGINDAFAEQHRHVGSVHILTNDQIPDIKGAMYP